MACGLGLACAADAGDALGPLFAARTVYEHPRGMLDLTVQQEVIKHLAIKLEAKNILDSQVMLTQGCGGKGVFGSTWYLGCSRGESAAVSRYTEGATFAVSGTYDF